MNDGAFFVVVVVVLTMFRLRLLDVVVHCWPDDLVDDIATPVHSPSDRDLDNLCQV